MGLRFLLAAPAALLLGSCGQAVPTDASPSANSAVRALDKSSATAEEPSCQPKGKVLQVGTWRGREGAFQSIQAAVNAASPGDWILIGPGDYRENGSAIAGVFITTPGIHLRGMDRNKVIVDGTQAVGGDSTPCNPSDTAQVKTAGGRNGIEVLKVDGVTIENLTTCNFLADSGNNGNQIWWNGGDGSGVIGMGSFRGAYLTASTTYTSAAFSGAYGIFASNSRGPGIIERSYASNMSDSSFYVGACPDCNSVLRHVHAQNSPQGFSGTNAGGHLVLEDSEWDQNRVGIAHTTLANDDEPSPQNGACPDHPGKSCTLVRRNYIHDNNNPNTPGVGLASTVPTGTGVIISGGRNDTVRDNLIVHNGAWGVMINDYPDTSAPAAPPWCAGGNPGFNPAPPFDQILGPVVPCYYFAFGSEVTGNRFQGNGFFANATNGDLANATMPTPTNNCFHDNLALHCGQVTSAPLNIQDSSVLGTCHAPWAGDTAQIAPLFLELLCATFGPGSGACNPADPGYPQPTQVSLLPIPQEQGMRNPCKGVPRNSWCKDHEGEDEEKDDD
jgi:hypothetical protein